MRLLVVLLLWCPLAFAVETADVVIEPQLDGSVKFTLSAERVKECAEHGGCKILTRDQFIEYIMQIKPQLCGERDI